MACILPPFACNVIHNFHSKWNLIFNIEINSFFSVIDDLIFTGGAQEDGAQV
jgi:hypothetical protein